MNNQELDLLVNKLTQKFKGVPGVDREFIHKCLSGIATLNDREIETKLALLINLL